jgi:hypothetical protein
MACSRLSCQGVDMARNHSKESRAWFADLLESTQAVLTTQLEAGTLTKRMSLPSTAQLKKALKIRAKIELLEHKLDRIIGATNNGSGYQSPKRIMSASARARIGKAQRARWAKLKGKSEAEFDHKPRRRKMPAAAKAKLAAIARTRWAKVKASGKSRL